MRPRSTLIATCLVAALTAAGTVGAAAQTGPDEGTADQGTVLERQDADNLLAVITKATPITPLDYAPRDLTGWPGTDFEMRSEVRDQLRAMFAAATDEGLGFRLISGYRSYETQAGTYDYWVRHYGRASADATSARAGHSEHQTGLAVDVDNTTGECYLDQCFGNTDEGRWIAAHAHEFGFVISYPKGAGEATGFAYEPWHIRYVGPQVAGEMHERGVLLLQDYVSVPGSSVRIGVLLGSRG